MGKLTAQQERLWLLRDQWGRLPGWSMNMRGGKKWERHEAALTKQGLLEPFPNDPESRLKRITDAGRAALHPSETAQRREGDRG